MNMHRLIGTIQRSVAFLVPLLTLSGACSKKEQPNPDAKPVATAAALPSAAPLPPATPTPVAASATTKVDVGPPLQEEAVRKLVDNWLKAQNTGDFSAYSGLYAARFTGVKRAGTYTAQYKQADWLKDRQSMFAKPQTVSI